jgi:hypothetical protein
MMGETRAIGCSCILSAVVRTQAAREGRIAGRTDGRGRRPDKLDLGRPDHDAVERLAVEVGDALDGPIVLPIWLEAGKTRWSAG